MCCVLKPRGFLILKLIQKSLKSPLWRGTSALLQMCSERVRKRENGRKWKNKENFKVQEMHNLKIDEVEIFCTMLEFWQKIFHSSTTNNSTQLMRQRNEYYVTLKCVLRSLEPNDSIYAIGVTKYWKLIESQKSRSVQPKMRSCTQNLPLHTTAV